MPKQEGARASQLGVKSAQARLPGMWQAALVTALSALLAGYWARSGLGAPGQTMATNVTQLEEVGPQDVTAALETVEGTPQQLAQFRERRACDRRLAWVTIMRGPGQPPGQIRLQSGGYLSPIFTLGDAPVRVALPYPAPYAIGHGTLAVLGTTADAMVALTPPWHVPKGGVQRHEVRWTPGADCSGPGK